MSVRRLECAVCGGDAGRYEQHWNRDTGYGLCRGCAEWLIARGTPPEEMADLYGRPGENYEAPRELA